MITALVWCERLLGLAILFQTIELLRLKPIWDDSGIWKWNLVRRDYQNSPKWILAFLDATLEETRFHLILKTRLICSVLIWFIPSSLLLAILFFSTWLIAIRWRGIFNGGSDSMTALIALSVWIGQTFHDHSIIVKICLTYIAVQLTLSYFLAGVAKLKNAEWREGKAMAVFFRTPRYDSPPAWARTAMDHPLLSKVVSWAIILLECTFLLAWMNSTLCCIYLMLAFSFHLLNFKIFGLNRFVFAWLAGFPAILFSAR